MSRFLSLCGGDRERYQLAVLFQMTFPGMPSVFYGDEQGIEGILEEEYRHPMKWKERDALFSFFKTAISLRRSEKVLRQGSYRTVLAEKGSRLYVYEREQEGEKIRIFLNMEEEKQDISQWCLGGEILWQKGKKQEWLMPKGFLIERNR